MRGGRPGDAAARPRIRGSPRPAPDRAGRAGRLIDRPTGTDARGHERGGSDRPCTPLGGGARASGAAGVRPREGTARHGSAGGPGLRERSQARGWSPRGGTRVPDLPVADPARAVPRERPRPGDRALGGRSRRSREEDRHDRGPRGRDLAGRRRVGQRAVVAPDPRRVPDGLGGAGRLPRGSVGERAGVGHPRSPRELAEGLARRHRLRSARRRPAGVPAEDQRDARPPRRRAVRRWV